MNNDKSVVSVIMGGGRGTRLYPLTMERCKPAVPLAGKYRLVDIPISNCINSGFNRIFLLSQFHTASLHRHIQSSYHFDSFGGGFVDILSAEQTEKSSDWYQGTADAVRRNLIHLRTFPHEYVLILSGDQLYKMDFRKIVDQHIATNAEVTIAAIPVPVSRVEGLGVMRINDDLSIAQFAEKPKTDAEKQKFLVSPAVAQRLTPSSDPRCLASMGIYVFNRTTLAEALDNKMKDFGREIIPNLLGQKRLFAHLFEGYWEDIGTVRAFFEANLALAQPLPQFNFFDPTSKIYTHGRHLPAAKINRCSIDHVLIGEGSIVTDSSLKRCIIGIRSFLGENAHMEDVVMMGADFFESDEEQKSNVEKGIPQLGVGRGCQIRHAIIDKNARIGEGCILSPEGKPDGNYAGGNVIIRDGILVVPKSAVLLPGTTV